MASLYSSANGSAVERLAARLRAERHGVVRRWQHGLNASVPDSVPLDPADADGALSGVIAEIASRLLDDAFGGGSAGNGAIRAATLLGDLRFTQGMPIGQVVDEWHALDDVLQAFIAEQAQTFDPPIDEAAFLSASRLVQSEIRALERRALESYVAGHQRTIEALTMQLRRVGRLVIHEIRRPLSVLRVLARTFTVAAGDVDAVRMVEILDRSVARLADVTRDLDRDSGLPHGSER